MTPIVTPRGQQDHSKKRRRDKSSSIEFSSLKRRVDGVNIVTRVKECKTTAENDSSKSNNSFLNISDSNRSQGSFSTSLQTVDTTKGSGLEMVKDFRVCSSSLCCRSALLVVGFYQGLLVGLVLKGGKFFMKFSTKHHVGSVNSVALTDRCIASSGTDERVFLFTNKLASSSLSPEARWKLRAAGQSTGVRLADLGSVSPPAEIVCLEFASHSQFLFCGSTAGHLLVYRTRDWSVSAAMKVHDRRLEALAVHPTSQGALVVTAGADHMLAVIDVVKEKLLTKRKYLSHSALAGDEGEEKQGRKKSREGKDGLAEQHSIFSSALRRDEPTGLLFSPTGEWLVAYSRQACEVFYGATMRLAIQYHNIRYPQPDDEIQAALLMDIALPSPSSALTVRPPNPLVLPSESILLVGDEAARIRYFSITRTLAEKDAEVVQREKNGRKLSAGCAGSSKTGDEDHKGGKRIPDTNVTPTSYVALHDPFTFMEVPISYPPSLQEEVSALLSKPIQADREARAKHPLRHISRIKGLKREGSTLFSLDARGIVICWKILLNSERTSKNDPPFRLMFETSANCQGRATSMASLWL